MSRKDNYMAGQEINVISGLDEYDDVRTEIVSCLVDMRLMAAAKLGGFVMSAPEQEPGTSIADAEPDHMGNELVNQI
jgi:hypothetical protein